VQELAEDPAGVRRREDPGELVVLDDESRLDMLFRHVLEDLVERFEETDEVDLLVVGASGRSGLRALGSVSERVAHRARCSVLVAVTTAPCGVSPR
jgi:nucleotide-binding universal stress UspA family protein